MEENNVCYDGIVRISTNQIIDFFYGEDGTNAIFLEDQVHRTINLINEKQSDEIYLNPSDPRICRESKEKQYSSSEICNLIR